MLILMGSMSCEGSKKERPSPLRTDSGSFKDGTLKMTYSSPAVRERVIWGELVPFDRLWRTGANEASVFYTDQNLKINGSPIDSGSYAVFTVPGEDKWTIFFNEQWNQWGTADYDSTLNVVTLEVVPYKNSEFSERMLFSFDKDALIFQWEKVSFSLSLE